MDVILVQFQTKFTPESNAPPFPLNVALHRQYNGEQFDSFPELPTRKIDIPDS